ncbi:hypothetical protein [Streptomyces hygroscopicus]|uniref:hypothetical protein n=1 Tax=Streptomyces hygroscopicus TaxID=1912 RepID=UPI00223EA07B|nr:hypothetical protein [Streptomyces hygroscopicus]
MRTLVYAPEPWTANPVAGATAGLHGAEELGGSPGLGFSNTADPRFVAITRSLGRDGRQPVEHVDILLSLDLLAVRPTMDLGLPSGELLLSAKPGWEAPQLHGCALHNGALSLTGAGDGRRIAWERGTILIVKDLPRPSLRGLPAASYIDISSSNDDPADALRRASFSLLGTRYHSDIPLAPGDAIPVDSSWQESGKYESVPTEYPGLAAMDEVFLDEDKVTLVVRRFGFNGHGSEYALPVTAERSLLVGEMRQEYLYSAAAYESVGADAGAAEILLTTPWNPLTLRDLLPVMSVRTADDAVCLLDRTPDQWQDDGWDLVSTTHTPALRNAEPHQSWRASEAVVLAAAGITSSRSYELRSAGFSSVEAAVAAHRERPTAAAIHARDLAAASEIPVPAQVGVELVTAQEYAAEELSAWRHDHRHSCGPEGWGLWAKLTRHTFTLRSGDIRVLWEVSNGWWAISEEGDAGQVCIVYTEEGEAQDSWKATQAALQEYKEQLGTD